MNEAYPRFGDFLNATGRPMLYSCSWPDYLNDHVNFSYVGEKCNLWRMYRDIYSQWPIIEQIIEWYGDNSAIVQVSTPLVDDGGYRGASLCYATYKQRRRLSLCCALTPLALCCSRLPDRGAGMMRAFLSTGMHVISFVCCAQRYS